MSEARLVGQRGRFDSTVRGSFSLLFSLAVRTLKFQSESNWNYATKSSDQEIVLDFIKELIELLT